MIKNYQKPQALLAYNEKEGKFLPRFANSNVDYLSNLAWIVHEHFEGPIVCVHWDGKNIEWAGEGKEPLPTAVDDLLHDKFDSTEAVFKKMFETKEVHLFMVAIGGKINDGAYGGKERLIGLDVLLENNFLGKGTIKQVFDAFDVNSIELFRVNNLQEAVDIVSKGAISKYNLKGSETPLNGLDCYPLQILFDGTGARICTSVRKEDLENIYNPNAAEPTESAPEPAPKKGKKGSKKPN